MASVSGGADAGVVSGAPRVRLGRFDMGEPGEFEKGNSVPPASAVDERDTTARDSDQSGLGSHPSRPPVRRSSLRPAPADYRPAMRDLSSVRPIMVVRAGDAGETQGAPAGEAKGTSSDMPRSFTLIGEPLTLPDPPAGWVESEPAEPHEPSEITAKLGFGATDPTPNVERSLPDVGDTAPVSRVLDRSSHRVPRHYLVSFGAGLLLAVAIIAWRSQHRHPVKSSIVTHQADAVVTPSAGLVSPVNSGLGIAGARTAPVGNPQVSEGELPTATPAAVAPIKTESTQVTLVLKPIDARVYYLGRPIPGPPYVFDIPKGQRVAIEVHRLGFVTAKVVLDDKKPVVNFGMLLDRKSVSR